MKKTVATLCSTLMATSLMTGAFAFAAPPSKQIALPDVAPIGIQSVTFSGSRAPILLEERTKPFTDASVEVTYQNGMTKKFPLSYQTLFLSTDVKNGLAAGTVIDSKGKPVMDSSNPNQVTPFVSDGPDGNVLMQIQGMSPSKRGGHPLALVTNYEYTSVNNKGASAYGVLPGSHGLSLIDQDKKTGKLVATDWNKIDMSSVSGSWIPCASSISPWNTALSSEEYEPDARDAESEKPKSNFLSSYVKAYMGSDAKPNPYRYGYITEITVNPNLTTQVKKHYAMGRFSSELARVMPDQRTTYIGDDGSYMMMGMFVADQAKDLSSGTLYAAKWNQMSDQNGGSANLTWIKLGSATNNEIEQLTTKTKFSDIFETATADTPGFTKIRSYPTSKDEWLKVKPGMEKAAAFLETRRYAAILGATTEFNKFEGVALNAKDKKVYYAISGIDKAMLAESNAPADHIKLPKLKAGAVYEMNLTGSQKDASGTIINSEYVGTFTQAVVIGEDLATADAYGNTAVVNKIANPDNVEYSEALGALIIGEDSGMHLNNFIWAYEVHSQKLSRILSVPAGGETNGLQALDDLNGFSYILANSQHPGDLADNAAIPADLKYALTKRIDAKAGYVGYIDGLPSLSTKLIADDQYVNAKEIAKLLDLKLKYNAKTKHYSLLFNGKWISFKTNQLHVNVNGTKKSLKQPAKIVNGSLMIPAALIQSNWEFQLTMNPQGYHYTYK